MFSCWFIVLLGILEDLIETDVLGRKYFAAAKFI